MTKTFATLGLALGVTLANLYGAQAAIDPNVPTSRSAAATKAHIDHDRLNDVQWAGVFATCQQVLSGFGDQSMRSYCREVIDVHFAVDRTNNEPNNG